MFFHFLCDFMRLKCYTTSLLKKRSKSTMSNVHCKMGRRGWKKGSTITMKVELTFDFKSCLNTKYLQFFWYFKYFELLTYNKSPTAFPNLNLNNFHSLIAAISVCSTILFIKVLLYFYSFLRSRGNRYTFVHSIL